ncbi:efflux RND transporter periplasmic adaptor subunit [Microvirga tunisiensis]|uniref:Efflux RND transporter periplasmic adaptor subunit n=2 Tax=Pannonibacter tanglangensis TaxID=2750084 RepID=A0ABW9ZIB7_9HYPH|nr:MULTISPECIES: efflux RND transporter periplasmic adaptor subunit [unclassified Pannonibacter]NBN64526.1 efflux RND transporter periplasmic adaptor subunit [Pannonibacter sp. XCT-34]NBN79060.1 efflux RND transporter periplasmic adaptor subunit [Pannonibacter sp. XCT-53]
MIIRLILALAVVAGLGYGAYFFNDFRGQMIAQYFAQPRPPVTVSTVEVKPEDWTPGIESIGTVRARQGVDVPARTSGIVKQISFTSNQEVTEGMLLVQLDDETEQADLIAAKANVERDSQALRRASTLNDRGFNSTQNLDNATAALDASRSQLERVQAAINQKKIVAPFSGTIGISRIDVGQYVPAGTAIATLQDLKVMKVDFSVPEQQLTELKIGQPVQVGLSEGSYTHVGKITGIDPKIDPQSRLISLQAEVENADGALYPGQFAFVRVVLPTEPDVIALPQTAVVQSLYGTYVFKVVEEAKEGDANAKQLIVRQVFVTTGRRFGGQIEVTKGLSAGDQIVSAGQNKLSVGNTVTIDNTVNPATAEMKIGG